MNLLNKLPNSVKTRIVITSVPFVFEGCETLIYNHPADQWIVDKVVPESLLSKSIRDKQARERGEGRGYQPRLRFLATNEWRDLNGDGLVGNNEFFGIKNKF